MKYLFAFDIDETLIHNDTTLSQRTIDAIKKCKEKGNIIAISSARGYGSCKDIADKISADYICCQSGNMITNNKDSVIYKNAFPKDIVKDLIDIARPYTKNIIIDSDKNLYGGINDEFAKKWNVIYCDTDELSKHNVYKMCIYYAPEYKNLIEDYCAKHNYVCRSMRTNTFLLISPSGSDKYNAIEVVMKKHNINRDHLVVFGDDASDILSIQNAKYGVAMANSIRTVLDVAKYTTLSNDEDGVAYFIERNFL